MANWKIDPNARDNVDEAIKSAYKELTQLPEYKAAISEMTSRKEDKARFISQAIVIEFFVKKHEGTLRKGVTLEQITNWEAQYALDPDWQRGIVLPLGTTDNIRNKRTERDGLTYDGIMKLIEEGKIQICLCSKHTCKKFISGKLVRAVSFKKMCRILALECDKTRQLDDSDLASFKYSEIEQELCYFNYRNERTLLGQLATYHNRAIPIFLMGTVRRPNLNTSQWLWQVLTYRLSEQNDMECLRPLIINFTVPKPQSRMRPNGNQMAAAWKELRKNLDQSRDSPNPRETTNKLLDILQKRAVVLFFSNIEDTWQYGNSILAEFWTDLVALINQPLNHPLILCYPFQDRQKAERINLTEDYNQGWQINQLVKLEARDSFTCEDIKRSLTNGILQMFTEQNLNRIDEEERNNVKTIVVNTILNNYTIEEDVENDRMQPHILKQAILDAYREHQER